MTSLKLTVPEPDPVTNPNLETKPQLVEVWASRLPYANPQQTAQLLLSNLSSLNRHRLSADNRLALMEILRPPFEQVLAAGRKPPAYESASSGKNQYARFVELLRRLTLEMAYGYKLVILGDLRPGLLWKGAQSLTKAIYFAVKYLGLEITFGYTLYKESPIDTWQEVYDLFREAEKRKLLDKQVSDPVCPGVAHCSIGRALKRIALLDAIDPYRLQQSHIWSVYGYLGWWAEEAGLEPAGAVSRDADHFAVDLSGRERPRILAAGTTVEDPARYRLLTTTGLVEQIRADLAAMQSARPAGTPPSLSPLRPLEAAQLLTRMHQAWHIPLKRRHPREPQEGWMIAACGLSAVHYFVQQGRLDDDPLGETPHGLSADIEIRQPGISQSGLNETRFPVFRWRLVNKSVSGVALQLPSPPPPTVQVGQLVVMAQEVDELVSADQVGIVRRLLQTDDDFLEAGVQIIPGSLVPTTLQPLAIEAAEADSQNCLMLHTPNRDLGTSILFAPHGLYRHSREYLLEDFSGMVSQIRAEKLIESTQSFDCYYVRDVPVDHQIEERLTRKASMDSEAGGVGPAGRAATGKTAKHGDGTSRESGKDPWSRVHIPRSVRDD